MIKLIIADDHEVVRRGLRMTIEGEEDMELLAEAANGRQLLNLLPTCRPDLILLDLQMPEMGGLEAARQIRRDYPDLPILVLTSFGDYAQLYAALQAGVAGYLLKDSGGDELVAAIRAAAQGQLHLPPAIARQLIGRLPPPRTPLDDLTERERETLALLASGMSNKEIGLALTLTETTVKGYVSAILSKLNVADRTQAALVAVRYGLINLSDLEL